MTTEKQYGELLRYERNVRGWSQEDVAQKIGSIQETVSDWENGRHMPNTYYRQKLCQIYDKTPQELALFDPDAQAQSKPSGSAHEETLPTENIPSPQPSLTPFYVVHLTYEQAVSHGIMPFEHTVQGSHERGEQEGEMDKRQFLVQGKNLIAAGVVTGIIGDAPLSNVTIPAEEFLQQCAISLKSCWQFMDLGTLDMAEQIIEVNIPTLLSLTISPSKHQQAAASLMTQAKIIQAILAGHQAKYSQREMYCQEAIKWSQLSSDRTIMAVALMYLGLTYIYHHPYKPQRAIESFSKALRILGNTPSLLRSVIHAGLADAYAQCAKAQETLTALALAKEHFPEYPEHDPSFLLADCSVGSLKDREGSTLNKLALHIDVQKQAYYDQADKVLDKSLALDRVPRGRIGGTKAKAQAALGLGLLDMYAAQLQESVLIAQSMGSKWQYYKVQEIHHQIPARWRHEQAIRDLEGVFESVRKSLFSPEIA